MELFQASAFQGVTLLINTRSSSLLFCLPLDMLSDVKKSLLLFVDLTGMKLVTDVSSVLVNNDVTNPAVLVNFSTMCLLQISNPCLNVP